MSYDGLIPVPPHLWHLTILSPFLSVPFPSQFLQGFFLSSLLLRTIDPPRCPVPSKKMTMLRPAAAGLLRRTSTIISCRRGLGTLCCHLAPLSISFGTK